MAWRPPQLPPVQKMPRRRKEKPSMGGRIACGVAGVILLASCGVGIVRALRSSMGGSPFMALAGLIPAVVLLRYALTGQFKVQ